MTTLMDGRVPGMDRMEADVEMADSVPEELAGETGAASGADPGSHSHSDSRSGGGGGSGGQPCADQPLTLRIEALLLATDRPLSDGKIAEILGLTLEEGGTKAVRAAIDDLNQAYADEQRSFRIESVAGGRQVLTLPQFGPVLHRLHQAKIQSRLTPAALETLAIVAYRQPILRADVEAIRGVASGEVLRGLMERRLVTIVGRAEELGRPMLYGTTREFLRVFGLASLDDLPQAKELRNPGTSAMAGRKTAAKEQQTSSTEAATEADSADQAPPDDDGDKVAE